MGYYQNYYFSGQRKGSIYINFYFKQNKKVQLDLQHLEIFIFSSILPGLPPGKMLEQKLRYGISRFGICVMLIVYFPGTKNYLSVLLLLNNVSNI